MNLVAADLRRRWLNSTLRTPQLKSEPPHVGCYDSGVQMREIFPGNRERRQPCPSDVISAAKLRTWRPVLLFSTGILL